MTTRTEVSKSNSVLHIPALTRISVFPFVLVAFLILSSIVIAVSIFTPEREIRTVDNRALQTWTARYQGMADLSAATDALSSHQALDAWAARYRGMADLSVATDGLSSQKALDAWAARYQGLVDLSAANDVLNSQKSHAAWASR